MKRREPTNSAIARSNLWTMEVTALRRLFAGDESPDTRADLPATPASKPAYQDGAAAPTKPLFQKDGTTAIVPIVGVLTKYPNWFDAICGCTFTLEIQSAIAAALDDESVEKIVLFIDSPGGAVAGTPDLGAFIAQNKSRKPIVAYCSDLCASGAYWLASQCTAIVANPSALIGSIGVYAVVLDQSGAAEKAGVKVYVVSDGQFKGLGEPGLPIDEKAMAETQRIVGATANLFRTAVAGGRELTPEAVAQLADGRVHIAAEAMSLGLIDGIGTFEATLTLVEENMSKPTNAVTSINPKRLAAAGDDGGGADASTPDMAEVCQKILDGVNALTEMVKSIVDDKKGDGKSGSSDSSGDGSSNPEDAAAKALATDRDRLKAITAACPGREKFATEQFLAGKSAVEAKAALADVLNAENTELKKKQLLAAGASDGTEALATGGGAGDSAATGTEQDPEQIWAKNVGGVQQSYRGKKNYFLAAFRQQAAKAASAK